MTFESLTLLDGVVQLRLKGRLDLAGIQSINDNFTLATTREGKFIVDLSDVSFLTSVRIRMLLIFAKAQVSRGGRVIIAAPQSRVLQVIEASGIDQLIEVVPDIEVALAKLKSAA